MEVVKASLRPQPPPSPSFESDGEAGRVGARVVSSDQTQLLRQFDAAQRACVAQQVVSIKFYNRFSVMLCCLQEELVMLRSELSDREQALEVRSTPLSQHNKKKSLASTSAIVA